jgi:hypothetical protein
MIWTALIWLRIWTNGGLLWNGSDPLGSMNSGRRMSQVRNQTRTETSGSFRTTQHYNREDHFLQIKNRLNSWKTATCIGVERHGAVDIQLYHSLRLHYQLHFPSFYSRRNTWPVPIGSDAGWDPEAFWTLKKTLGALPLPGNEPRPSSP